MNFNFLKVSITPVIVASAAITTIASDGAVIFSQDFSANNTLATYVNATTPSSGQFNAISSSGAGTVVSVTSGVLTFARTGNAGTFSRTTDFSPTPTAIIYQFDLNISGNSTATTTAAGGATFYL